MITNNLIIIKTSNMVLNPLYSNDNAIIECIKNNTYFNKIIGFINDEKKILKINKNKINNDLYQPREKSNFYPYS